MKKTIHKIIEQLGYKISNISKKEAEKQRFVQRFAVGKDANQLVYNSTDYLFVIKKHFPELSLVPHKEGVLASFSTLKLYLESSEEFFILKEVFIEKDYNLLSQENFVVFDIGMNIGISSLFFALQKNVNKIYSFEPVATTYHQAQYNLALNPSYAAKIEAFHCGLGGATRVEKVLYNAQAKGNCGIRRDLSLVLDDKNAAEIEINIKNVEEVLPALFAQHPNEKKILKIDCEGAEYEILQKMNEGTLLAEVDILLIEWHDKGATILEDLLVAHNFSVLSRHLTAITGMIYAFKNRSHK
ncbi:FkbM family methyltransferase [Flavobacterium nackdongense]|uniref:FkbM family methyltransferase n=1 Tax=Flavobacterium nackdongense TaxID=2547394 RepID=A0A4P6YGB7_9FLAO|nr:FkbM family methyltransferase [Flavobacterium nackdongense]QBN19845.1 FkbM family methyltransferase [Flavobacterium nackdongense]